MRDETLLVQAWTTRKSTLQDRFDMKSLAEEEGVPQSVFAAFKEVSHRWIPTSLERYLTICPAKQKKGEKNTWPVLQGNPLQLWAALLSEPAVAVHCLRILPCMHIGQQGEVQMEAVNSRTAKSHLFTMHSEGRHFLLCRDGGSGKMYTNQPEEQFLQDGKELL